MSRSGAAKRPPLAGAAALRMDNLNLNPLPWNEFFKEEIWYENPGQQIGNFHAYNSGTRSKPCIVLIHGGGYSALSWGVLTEYLNTNIGNDVEILAIDLRGHGETDADPNDLDLQILSDDIMAVLGEHFQRYNAGKWPHVFLVGHSLGGAIAVDVAHKLTECAALILLDVSESIAMESLSGMKHFLRSRPQAFPNIQAAIFWTINSKTITNNRSARVSVPGMLVAADSKKLAAKEEDNAPTTDTAKPLKFGPLTAPIMGVLLEENNALQEESLSKEICDNKEEKDDDIEEDDMSDDSDEPEAIPATATKRYVWRIDLMKTEPFWVGWYEHLSQKFLAVNTPAKVLILAKSTDAIDRDAELLRGHITGKFTLHTIQRSGHMVQENAPDAVGEYIIQLLKRHRYLTTVPQPAIKP